MLEELSMHRQILADLTSRYLEILPGQFDRLAYLASLRQPSGSSYAHERLSAVYDHDRVSELLRQCHEELFERLLETPLAIQEADLFRYLESLRAATNQNLPACRVELKSLIPPGAPDYLKELFCSNLAALLELLESESSKARSGR
jgi:hypothetical protein